MNIMKPKNEYECVVLIMYNTELGLGFSWVSVFLLECMHAKCPYYQPTDTVKAWGAFILHCVNTIILLVKH